MREWRNHLYEFPGAYNGTLHTPTGLLHPLLVTRHEKSFAIKCVSPLFASEEFSSHQFSLSGIQFKGRNFTFCWTRQAPMKDETNETVPQTFKAENLPKCEKDRTFC